MGSSICVRSGGCLVPRSCVRSGDCMGLVLFLSLGEMWGLVSLLKRITRQLFIRKINVFDLEKNNFCRTQDLLRRPMTSTL